MDLTDPAVAARDSVRSAERTAMLQRRALANVLEGG